MQKRPLPQRASASHPAAHSKSRATQAYEEIQYTDRSGNVIETERVPVPFHRAGHSSNIHPEDEPYWAEPRNKDPNPLNLADDLDYPDLPSTSPTSAIKRTAYLDTRNPKKTKRVRQRTVDRYTLMIVLGLALIVMILGWFLFTLIANWWTNTTDDWKYGNPRTFQTDQFVGQGDSPEHPDHFIVVNTHGQVIVIQLNSQHPELNHTYGITTASDPKTPVSLIFRPTGTTWAMYVVIGDTTPYTVEYVPDGKQFVPASH